MRVIRFTPKEEYYGDSKFPEFELYLRTGDVYAMDGALQQVYTHSVEASTWMSMPWMVPYSTSILIVWRLVVKLKTWITGDTGFPLADLLPTRRTWAYSTTSHPKLKEGFSYSYQELSNMPVHTCVLGLNVIHILVFYSFCFLLDCQPSR
jgi:hypothetical protein